MAPDLDKKAKEAFVDDNFELAVELYTQALALDPKNADLLADRAQANIKLGNFTEAVSDASKAIELDPSMSKAYLRKGIACMKLEEYQTAKVSLKNGSPLAPGDSRFTKLVTECDELIAAEETGNLSKPQAPDLLPNAESSSVGLDLSNISAESPKDAEFAEELVQTTSIIKPKFRHDFYNASTEVVLTIFAKGIPAKDVHVNFGEQIVSVSIDIPGEDTYHLQQRLFAKIIPEKCKFQVFSTKVEIRLAKAEAITWKSLEFCKGEMETISQKIIAPPDAVLNSRRPVYPSSKSKVDWDKLEAEVKKEEKDEKLEGDAALNKMFRDIYRNADEDTRRAMSKSFIESNGTVLSTDWKEVGTKKVDGTPPDGMQLKKWEY